MSKYHESSILDRGYIDQKYLLAIRDLNKLITINDPIAYQKYNDVKEILPLFKKHLNLADIEIEDLNKLNVIHVTGTKGKGSTCAFVESILQNYELKVGFYNSPHLIDVTERFRINGKPIGKEKFAHHFRVIFDKLKVGCDEKQLYFPSYFSFLTILAFRIFLEEKVDCAIMEVGVGGDFDPTNIVQKPVACGITTLDIDHTSILGKTIEQITLTKAGIAKEGVPLFTVRQTYDQTLPIIQNQVEAKHSKFFVCDKLDKGENLKLGIKGDAQYLNASLASNLAYQWLSVIRPDLLSDRLTNTLNSNITSFPEEFRKGLKMCNWSGRCQIHTFSINLTFYLDGAHTQSSMANCKRWFEEEVNDRNSKSIKILALNIIGDRDRREVMKPLLAGQKLNFDYVVFSTNKTKLESEKLDKLHNSSSKKGKSLQNLENNASIWVQMMRDYNHTIEHERIFKKSTTSELVEFCKNLSLNNKVDVLVTGSLHFVGAVLETLQSN